MNNSYYATDSNIGRKIDNSLFPYRGADEDAIRWEQERARVRLEIMKHEPRTRQVQGNRVEFDKDQLSMLPSLSVNVQGGSLNSYADNMGLTEYARGDPMPGLEQSLWLREEEEGRLHGEQHLDNMSKLQTWIQGVTGRNEKFSSDVSQQKECFSQLPHSFFCLEDQHNN